VYPSKYGYLLAYPFSKDKAWMMLMCVCMCIYSREVCKQVQFYDVFVFVRTHADSFSMQEEFYELLDGKRVVIANFL